MAQLLTLASMCAAVQSGAFGGNTDTTAAPTTCLRDLESESIDTREKASSQLKLWANASPDRLLGLITPQSTAEQRERLLALAFEAFQSSPRGALGVSFGPLGFRQAGLQAEEVFEEGIPIESTLVGFDSGRVLKGGDLLRSIGGVRVKTNMQCRVQIISYDPGQQTRLEIEREGRPMFVTVRLGRWNDLRDVQGGAQSLMPAIVQAAWKSRVARSTSAPLADGESLQPLPGALAWVEGDRLTAPVRENGALVRDVNFQVRADPQQPQLIPMIPGGSNERYTLEGTEAPVADLVAGGEPRGKLKAAPIPSRATSRRGGMDQNRDALIVLIQQLRIQVRDLDQRLELARQSGRDPKLTPEQRAENLQLIDALEGQRAAIDSKAGQLQEILRPR